jgi:hypothetical protein
MAPGEKPCHRMSSRAHAARVQVAASRTETGLIVSDLDETFRWERPAWMPCWLDDFRQMAGCCRRSQGPVVNH